MTSGSERLRGRQYLEEEERRQRSNSVSIANTELERRNSILGVEPSASYELLGRASDSVNSDGWITSRSTSRSGSILKPASSTSSKKQEAEDLNMLPGSIQKLDSSEKPDIEIHPSVDEKNGDVSKRAKKQSIHSAASYDEALQSSRSYSSCHSARSATSNFMTTNRSFEVSVDFDSYTPAATSRSITARNDIGLDRQNTTRSEDAQTSRSTINTLRTERKWLPVLPRKREGQKAVGNEPQKRHIFQLFRNKNKGIGQNSQNLEMDSFSSQNEGLPDENLMSNNPDLLTPRSRKKHEESFLQRQMQKLSLRRNDHSQRERTQSIDQDPETLKHLSIFNSLREEVANCTDPPSEAVFRIGLHYFKGLGVQKDEIEAAKWWIAAAKNGHASAMYNVGQCYSKGSGLQQNHSKALEWYKKAAENGLLCSQFQMGACYFAGIGCEKDHKAALYWYHKAAEGGDVGAQAALGRMYLPGSSPTITSNVDKAIRYLTKAANNGNVPAMSALANIYQNGVKGIQSNALLGASWARKAADAGSADAQDYIARLYYVGHLMTEDRPLAIKYWSDAARQGHAKAQTMLGHCFLKGDHTAKDPNAAMLWYNRAAEKGHEPAMYGLAECFEKGANGQKNSQQAFFWYSKAAERGNTKGSNPNKTNTTISKGNANAQFKMSGMLFLGKGTGKDKERAMYWLEKAVNQGHKAAAELFEQISGSSDDL